MSRRALTTSDSGFGWHAHLPPAAVYPELARAARFLADEGSLTRLVRSVSRDFAVDVRRQGFARPDRDGAPVLSLARQGWVREVVLRDGNEPLIFAHTLAAADELVSWPWLRGLGRRPLGEVLFRHPRVLRLPLRYRRLDRRHPLYDAARRATGVAAGQLWARRSLFELDDHRLLVTEVFLPTLLDRLCPR